MYASSTGNGTNNALSVLTARAEDCDNLSMASIAPGFHFYLTSYSGDFNKERDVILSQVVPELREWLDSENYQLILTDIRWGGPMTEERVRILKQDLLSTVTSPRFFLNLTSESLGLIPYPHDHPPDTAPEYCKALGMGEAEYDIISTAYRPQADNAVYIMRDDNFLDYLLEEEESFFVKHNILSDDLRTTVNTLHRLPESQVYEFKYEAAGWDYGTNRLEIKLDIPKLTRKICDKVRHQVRKSGVLRDPALQLQAKVESDVGLQENIIQTTFLAEYSKNVYGRDDICDELIEYVESGGKDVPVLLHGGEGSGKTCALNTFTRHLLVVNNKRNGKLTRSDGRKWRVFYHFAGSTCTLKPSSSELLPMLRRLLLLMETVPESGLPRDLDALAALCCMALSNPATEPIIVIVDALDQFDSSGKAADIVSWLPRKLGPNVRCVVSSVTNSPQHKVLTKRESLPQEITLQPLTMEHRKLLVADVLSRSAHGFTLSEERVYALLAKPSSSNPLWLTIACGELATLTSAKQLDQRICSLPCGLLSLLEEVLQRVEAEEEESTLLRATLCLLEASSTGLQETELLHILATSDLAPPQPFDEKEERECSEKESLRRRIEPRPVLPEHRWRRVYETLRQFLRPVGPSRQGRLHFYHRALSRAVRKRYFHECAEENQGIESPELKRFWHQKLADYFQDCTDPSRQAEEYLAQLCILESWNKLARVLCVWPVFELLFHEEYSPLLLSYWRQAASYGQAGSEGEGGAILMKDMYKEALGELEGQDEKQLAIRYEQVARVFLQAGLYTDALELCKVSVKWEEKELGNRPERMVELYSLMAEIYDEKLKLNDFVSRTQLPDLKKTISFGRKSIELREKLDGPYHKFKLSMSLMKLAFSLESWEACGGDSQMSGRQALTEANRHIDKAIDMFRELKDMGHYAEALMTKGVLAPRGSSEQLKYYNEAQEICCQVYGEISLLSSRLFINIGIVHEDNEDFIKAFDFFKKWAFVSEKVLGPDHPKTLRAKGVLKEPRYRLVAQRLKDLEDHRVRGGGGGEGQDGSEVLTEERINHEAGIVSDRGGQGGSSYSENREEEEGAERGAGAGTGENLENFVQVTEDLQHAINELLQRALGEVDIRQEVLQNILNSFQATSCRPAVGSGGGTRTRESSSSSTVEDTGSVGVAAVESARLEDEDNDDDDDDDDELDVVGGLAELQAGLDLIDLEDSDICDDDDDEDEDEDDQDDEDYDHHEAQFSLERR